MRCKKADSGVELPSHAQGREPVSGLCSRLIQKHWTGPAQHCGGLTLEQREKILESLPLPLDPGAAAQAAGAKDVQHLPESICFSTATPIR